jgi:hypothetical protein
MELKNVNHSNDNVAISNLNNINILFWRIVKIEFKNKHHTLKNVMIAQETKFYILFTSLINSNELKLSL